MRKNDNKSQREETGRNTRVSERKKETIVSLSQQSNQNDKYLSRSAALRSRARLRLEREELITTIFECERVYAVSW